MSAPPRPPRVTVRTLELAVRADLEAFDRAIAAAVRRSRTPRSKEHTVDSESTAASAAKLGEMMGRDRRGPDRSEPEIPAYLDRLGAHLERLEMQVDNLVDAISPALRPASGDLVAAPAKDDPTLAPLARVLLEHARRVERLAEILIDTRDRLAL